MLRSQLIEPLARTRSIAQILLPVASIAWALRTVSGSELEQALKAIPFTGLLAVLSLSFLQSILGATGWHHTLRYRRASAHLGATIRTLLLHRWQLSRAETYVREFDQDPSAVQRAVLDHYFLQSLAALSIGCVGWLLLPELINREVDAADRVIGWLFLAAVLLEWIGRLMECNTGAARPGRDRGELRSAFVYAVSEQAMGGIVLWVSLRAAGALTVPWTAFIAVTAVSRIATLGGRSMDGWGVREFLFVAVLPLSALPPVIILSSGFLILASHASWGAIAWIAAQHEEQRRGDLSLTPVRSISVVIPTLNEAAGIAETIRRARRIPEVCELILVDGGSQDGTAEVGAVEGCRVLHVPAGRGGQLRAGALAASGDVILLLHADTWLEADAGVAVLQCLKDRTVVAGGFWKRFRNTPLLLLGSRPKCAVRLFLGRRIVGDMAMFVRRDVLVKIGGVPAMELMEDFELSKRLRDEGRLALADSTVTTSARRFRQKGVLLTYLKMWRVATLYRLGKSPAELRRIYG